MHNLRFTAVISLLFALLFTTSAQGQIAQNTAFYTAMTYQNIGTAPTAIKFLYYNQSSSSYIQIDKNLNAGAAGAYMVGGLSTGFNGVAVISADQPLVATIVQIPDTNQNTSSPVYNRAISNAFHSGAPKLYLASLLKSQFSTNSRVSIQNTEAKSVDIRLTIKATTGTTYVKTWTAIPPGSGIAFAMDTLSGTTPALPSTLDSSAVIEGFLAGTNTQWSIPASVAATVVELSTSGKAAKAFEAESNGGTTFYMATALCDVFVDQRTSYAVQNLSNAAISVLVTYSNGAQKTKSIAANAKASFGKCEASDNSTSMNGLNGSAKIQATGGDIIAIGKVYKNNASQTFSTAFLGERYGSYKLALPYVRYSSDAYFNAGSRERTSIAIQNVDSSAVGPINVRYRDNTGAVLGTHTISSIAAGAKANSTPINAGSQTALLEFGSPDSNANGGWGGSVTIEGPATAHLIAIARVYRRDTSLTPNIDVAEDYNAFQVP